MDNKLNATKRSVLTLERRHFLALLLCIYDLLTGIGSYFIALWLRFDCNYTEIPSDFLNAWLKFTPIYAVAIFIVLWQLRLYKSVWKFASFVELNRILLATAILGVFHTLGITLIFRTMPIAYYLIGIALQLMFMVLIRFAYPQTAEVRR